MVNNGTFFIVPAYPLESVYDPTGAGDTFAGGFMGYIAAQDRGADPTAMRRAMVYGSVMASFTVEDFSLNRLLRLTPVDVADRYAAFHDLIRLEP
jgi:sugar/nucleoside kinase (ribokinase family)